MTIVGFSFIKVNAEKEAKGHSGNVEINHNFAIKDVSKTSLKLGVGSSDVLRVIFEYIINYKNLGKVSLTGEVIYSDTKEIINESLKGWEVDKVLTKIVSEAVIKFAYSKSVVKSFEISDNVGLPAPIPIPKIDFTAKKN